MFLTLICVISAIFAAFLSFHAVLIYVLPLLLAVQYRKKQTLWITYAVNDVTMTISMVAEGKPTGMPRARPSTTPRVTKMGVGGSMPPPRVAPPRAARGAGAQATKAAAAQPAAAVAAGATAAPPLQPQPQSPTEGAASAASGAADFADTTPTQDPSDLPDHDGFAELAESLGTENAEAAGALEAPEQDPHSVIHHFVWAYESDLPEARRDALMGVIGGIPCPPQSLHQLLAPDFFDRIGPSELTDLLRGEPLIAAKVLATVNAPFYGLSHPVTNIEHAVAFLGMETVRNICVQYLLAQAFKPELSSSQRSFDTIWRASTIASELALRLGKALNLPDYGALATKVVMAFVGHLAAAALLARNPVG